MMMMMMMIQYMMLLLSRRRSGRLRMIGRSALIISSVRKSSSMSPLVAIFFAQRVNICNDRQQQLTMKLSITFPYFSYTIIGPH